MIGAPPPRSHVRARWGPSAPAVVASLVLCLALGIPAAAGVRSAGSGAFYVEATALPPEGEIPLTVAFNATPTSGTATGYSWDFGDGSWLNGTNRTDATPVHTFTTVRTFPVTVTLWEGTTSSTASILVYAYEGPFEVAVQATPDRGDPPLTVLFTTNISGGSGTYVGFDWRFGDGGVGEGPEVANTYQSAGTYVASVTVNDSSGASVTTDVRVTVGDPSSSGSSAISPPEEGAILFGVTGAVGVTALVTLNWRGRRIAAGSSFGPGSPSTTAMVPPGATLSPVLAAPSLAPSSPDTAVPEAVDEESTALERSLSPEYVAEGRRLSQLLILRLASLGHRNPEDVPDTRWTQQGLGEHLGVAQGRVSNVLRRLEAAGVLEVELRHVIGRPRRVKVYQLTSRGEALARSYRGSSAGTRPGPPDDLPGRW
ncbi:MAG TPA: PKD domain-containing protein [Thermoplasmata archaeon]|nr:PKD domain-containing protein [Thermoplasmata archaeon]